MKRYVIQFQKSAWDKRYGPPAPCNEFDTLEEAVKAYKELGPFLRPIARVAETYTVTRFKPVKI